MKRRALVTGFCLLVSGGSGVLGYRFGQSSANNRSDFRVFLLSNPNITFHHMPTELLLKLYSGRLTDVDKREVVRGLVHHNRALFVVDPYTRTLGVPGFYRVAD